MTLNSANDQSYKIKHIGIVMDGNGRWAKAKGLPRVLGHHEGVKAVESALYVRQRNWTYHTYLYMPSLLKIGNAQKAKLWG